jgi:hypothetical protein
MWQEHAAYHHLQQPCIANQQDWREWGYLVIVVCAEQQDTRTATSSLHPPPILMPSQIPEFTRLGSREVAATTTGSCNVLVSKH